MHVCGCVGVQWGTGVVIGMDWMYLVRITGSVAGLAQLVERPVQCTI